MEIAPARHSSATLETWCVPEPRVAVAVPGGESDRSGSRIRVRSAIVPRDEDEKLVALSSMRSDMPARSNGNDIIRPIKRLLYVAKR